MADFRPGMGRIRVITGTNPAANVEASDTVPANVIWRLISWSVSLVTDANAANRRVSLTLDDGANIFCQVPNSAAITASLTTQVTFGSSEGYEGTLISGANSQSFSGLPSALYLPGGFRIRTVTLNRQIGDDYASPYILVEEFILPQGAAT